MPRPATDIKRGGSIHIPKDRDILSQKIILTDTDGTEHDVTNFVLSMNLNRIATVGISNFTIILDNNAGRFKDTFVSKNTVDFFFDYKDKDSLLVNRMRGYIDNTFDEFNISQGSILLIEGRDVKVSDTNEHFVDTHITLQFNARNNLDVWLGTTGTQDAEGNFPDGILHNSGMIMKVFDTSNNTFKVYKDLTTEQKNALKAQTGYTSTFTGTFVDRGRLAMSQPVATEGDYEFRIFFDSSDGNTYFMVHPEQAVTNNNESIIAGQNLISLGRFGKDIQGEFNRIKQSGANDGNILLMRTQENTTKQSALWIRDKEETSSALTTETEVNSKAIARLNKLQEAIKKGGVSCLGFPSLQPGERIRMIIPYIINELIKVKSFTVTFDGNSGLQYNIDIQDRETRFEKLFKDRIDENVNVIPSDNPNGFRNSMIFNFEDPSQFILTDCQITDGVLSLEDGKVEGTCVTVARTVGKSVARGELRIKANNFFNTTYRISNQNNANGSIVSISRGLFNFNNSGEVFILEISLRESRSSVSPEFDLIEILY